MKKIENNLDAIVVGSGPGGATVARELTKRKKRVLILEWGSDEPIEGSNWQTLKMAAIPGKSALLTYGGLVMVRGITLGGSSTFYYATAFDPPLKALRAHGVDIADEIREAKRELPIAPLADKLVGPMAARIMESAISLGYNWQKMPKLIYQDRCRSDCDKCTLGCPDEAKWSARNYIAEALDNGARAIFKARVKRVIIENKKAVGVEFTRGGRSYTALAPSIIVAAGGIGSPIILRASGIEKAGYDFFYDPLIIAMGAVNDIKGGKEIPMAAGAHLEEDGIIMTDLILPKILYRTFTAAVLRFDRLFSHARTLQIMIKARDSLGGRITDSGGLRKGLSDSDRRILKRGYSRARDILMNAGARHIYKSWYIAAHPGGTVKINEIIDSDLKTEYDNLYVCDCSVIPDGCGIPPTLTLIGLGKRLAKHLAGEKKKKKPPREKGKAARY
jgi:choline dehydrogenase-like flavoprotein